MVLQAFIVSCRRYVSHQNSPYSSIIWLSGHSCPITVFAFTILWRNCSCAWCKSFPQLPCWAHWCTARSRLRLDLPSCTVTRRAIKPNCRSVVDVAKYKLCLRTVWKQLLWSQAENDYCSSLVVSFVARFSFHFLFSSLFICFEYTLLLVDAKHAQNPVHCSNRQSSHSPTSQLSSELQQLTLIFCLLFGFNITSTFFFFLSFVPNFPLLKPLLSVLYSLWRSVNSVRLNFHNIYLLCTIHWPFRFLCNRE